MTPFNPEQDERVPPIYGDSAMYIEPPVGDNQRNGVVPLDTLPAQWWNWLWNNVTKYCNAVVNPEIHDIVNELTNVLSAAGMTPDSVNQDQLLRAIRKIVDDTTATTSQKGVVKASNANGKVSVDSDGVMTANGLGDVAQLTTAIKTSVVNALNEVVTNIGALSGLSTTAKTDIVAAINELVTSLSTLNTNKVDKTTTVNGKALNSNITLSATDVGALPDTTPIPAAQVNSDWNATSGVAQILNKPTIPADYPPKNHASTDTTYGTGTSVKYGHVKASGMVGTNVLENKTISGTETVSYTCPAGQIISGHIRWTIPLHEECTLTLKVPNTVIMAGSGETGISSTYNVSLSQDSFTFNGESAFDLPNYIDIYFVAISTQNCKVGV